METAINNFVHGNIYKVRPDQLTPDKNQVRKYFSPEAHAELTKTVLAHGLIQPITVTLLEGNLQIVAGERRWNAAKAAGLEFVQVKYVDKNVAAISLIENLQRENLLPIEKAVGLLRLKEQHGYTNEQLGDIIGKSATTVSEILTLTKLSDDIKSECGKGNQYVHSRLLAIAREPNTKAMRKQFLAYKSVLEGSVRNPGQRLESNVTDGLISRLTGIITQIVKLKIEPLNNNERKRLIDKLDELELCVQENIYKINALESSEFRSHYKKVCQGASDELPVLSKLFPLECSEYEVSSGESCNCDDIAAEEGLSAIETALRGDSMHSVGGAEEASYDSMQSI